MRQTDKAVSDYMRELERHLDCPRGIRRPFLNRTQNMAEDFVQNRPETDVKEVKGYLGDPQELAQGFLETLDPVILKRYRKKKRLVWWALITLLAAAVIYLGTWVYELWSRPITMEVTETIIIYRDVEEKTK